MLTSLLKDQEIIKVYPEDRDRFVKACQQIQTKITYGAGLERRPVSPLEILPISRDSQAPTIVNVGKQMFALCVSPEGDCVWSINLNHKDPIGTITNQFPTETILSSEKHPFLPPEVSPPKNTIHATLLHGDAGYYLKPSPKTRLTQVSLVQ